MFGRRWEKVPERAPLVDTGLITFPHCDALILHKPGTCEVCDMRPDWQALRSAQGIAYSDSSEAEIAHLGLTPCPSTYRRSAELRDRWGGNRPVRA